MWHEKKVIAWLLRDLTISRVHMQYKRLSPMPWYLPKARSLGIHRIHRPLYGANDRLIVVDTIGQNGRLYLGVMLIIVTAQIWHS